VRALAGSHFLEMLCCYSRLRSQLFGVDVMSQIFIASRYAESRRSASLRSQAGFSLIELMIVVAIVGVLSAVALPQFNEYRSKSNDASAQADSRNALSLLVANLIR
jgi:type IV pilus assembly protein PilA